MPVRPSLLQFSPPALDTVRSGACQTPAEPAGTGSRHPIVEIDGGPVIKVIIRIKEIGIHLHQIIEERISGNRTHKQPVS